MSGSFYTVAWRHLPLRCSKGPEAPLGPHRPALLLLWGHTCSPRGAQICSWQRPGLRQPLFAIRSSGAAAAGVQLLTNWAGMARQGGRKHCHAALLTAYSPL
jgi:hypothetical protein